MSLPEIYRPRHEGARVDATRKSGSFRDAGTNEPKPEGMEGNLVEMAAYEAKVMKQVQSHLQDLGWHATDILGSEKITDRISNELNLPWASVKKTLHTLAAEEQKSKK